MATKKPTRKSAMHRLYKTVNATKRMEYPDPSGEGEGFWIDVAPALRTNPAYRAALLQAQQKYGRVVDESVQDEPMRWVYATAIVRNWGGDTGYDEFSFDNVMDALKELPELFTEVITEATNFANFREEATAAAVKNS